MPQAVNMAAPHAPASPLFLREAEIRRGIELMFFGWNRLMDAVDGDLDRHGLGRAHQRALYFIARHPGLSVGHLLGMLGITKQSLGRVLKELDARGLVEARAGRDDRRQKLLRLTPAGAALEGELFEALRMRLAQAYGQAGPDAVGGFWRVLEGLLPVGERERLAALAREG